MQNESLLIFLKVTASVWASGVLASWRIIYWHAEHILAKVPITVPRCVTLTCSVTFSYSANSCWDKRTTYIFTYVSCVGHGLTQTLLVRCRYTFIRKDIHFIARTAHMSSRRHSPLSTYIVLSTCYDMFMTCLLVMCNLSCDWIGAAETSCRKPSLRSLCSAILATGTHTGELWLLCSDSFTLAEESSYEFI